MKTKNYFAVVSIELGGNKSATYEFGPYTRKRDVIRGMERSLPKNFKFDNGYIRRDDCVGIVENVEEISRIGNGKIQTWESSGLWRTDDIKYHTYKFGK